MPADPPGPPPPLKPGPAPAGPTDLPDTLAVPPAPEPVRRPPASDTLPLPEGAGPARPAGLSDTLPFPEGSPPGGPSDTLPVPGGPGAPPARRLDDTLDAAPPVLAGPVEPAEPPDGAMRLQTAARFDVTGELGRGGMGVVLEARDPELGRSVALKMVLGAEGVQKGQVARFVAEARVTGQLQHPNIVPVYSLGNHDGHLFYVMRKVEGLTLGEVLGRLADGGEEAVARWPLTRLLQVFVQVCNAVAYAHSRGVLHRDLKPANIMLGAFGQVLVMDWGLVRVMGEPEEVRHEPLRPAGGLTTVDHSRPDFAIPTVARTMDGVAVGTPGYMSPEQARGDLDTLDGRSDLWSLGAILYEILTLERAYQAADIYALVFKVLGGPPEDPRRRAPGRRLDPEIAEICMKALATLPEERFDTVADLAEAVQQFLEGSKRREAAGLHVDEAEEAFRRYLELRSEQERLVAREAELVEAVDPWVPVAEKAELVAAQDRLEKLGDLRVDALETAVGCCEQALSQDPGNERAARQLARMHYVKFEEAERAGDAVEQRHHRGRVLRYDDGHYAALLHGTGRLTLKTEPEGALVVARKVVKEGVVWSTEPAQALGSTPLDVPLEMGSWLLTLKRRGMRDVVYPVNIERGAHWDGGDRPVPLFTERQLGPDWVYVPAGPFVAGGDALAWRSEPRQVRWVEGFFAARHHVTMNQWARYLSWLHRRDPEAAWLAVPRLRNAGRGGDLGQMWKRPAPDGGYRVPEVDDDGDPWDPHWPACAVSFEDVQGYLAWYRETYGLPVDLPSEDEWEKAARGVDGRFLPWGDRFDSSLCSMLTSRPGPPRPEPVGSRPRDRSVYGVQDVAGGIRTLCRDPEFDGKPELRPIRGGAYSYDARNCRPAWRNGVELQRVAPTVGFRLVRPLPGPEGDGADS